MVDDDRRRFLAGIDARAAQASRFLSPSSSGQPSFVGRVVGKPTVPTSIGCYFSVNPVSVKGQEVESGTASLSVDSSTTVLVYVCGRTAPILGDDLICRFIGNRWVAEKTSGQPISGAPIKIVGCPCLTTPAVLQMVSNHPSAQNGMFQSTPLVYGPTPPVFQSLQIPDSIHLSPGTFTDAITGDAFRYYLACEPGAYLLRRLFPTTTYVSPYQDDIRYRWSLSAAGNVCSPMMLLNGRVYDGGDPTSSVVVTQ
ncbi:hypothetical protein EP7_005226 [Isosphaeraceae bacterium EP7]